MNPNKLACNCRNVTYGKIEKAIREGARSFEEVQAATNCSKSCGKCREVIEMVVKNYIEDVEKEQGK